MRLCTVRYVAALWGIAVLVSCTQNFSEEGVNEALRAKELTAVGGQPNQKAAQAENEGDRTSLGGITVPLPAGWRVATPSSSMRVAEYELPGAGGAATLAVFHFGPGQGGSVQANIDRWIGQFQQADGSDSRTKARLWNEEVGGMKASMVDLSGIYSVGPMAGGSGEPLEGYRMVGAIVEAANGPFFFKLTGPEQTVAQWEDSFSSYIHGVRPE